MSQWLECLNPVDAPRIRLVCIPYAGGSTRIFREWPRFLPSGVELWAVQLPGRANRLDEPIYNRMILLAAAIAQAVLPKLDQPMAIFGHSMGALLGFEIARLLASDARRNFVYLFVAASRAPHIPVGHAISSLPEPYLLEELRRLNGMPEELLGNRELLRLVLPALRADLSACEKYLVPMDVLLNCPITVFGGKEDDSVPVEDLNAWKRHTHSSFECILLPGHHFFLESQRQALIARICDHISKVARSPCAQLKPCQFEVEPRDR